MLTENQLLQQGRYRIIQEFGRNGTGLVYEAYDKALDANVLLKEIKVNLNKVTTISQLEAHRQVFAQEARFLTGIKHESLVCVHHYFSEVDRHYLVTEMFDGKSLQEVLKNDRPAFSLTEAAGWADQLLDALNYLHTQKPPVFHHHIKPENVKLTAAGQVKLAISGLLKNPQGDTALTVTSQDLAAEILNYLPFEQIWSGLDLASQNVISDSYDERSLRILEQPADEQSDLFALGATLYHLLTGRMPVDALERSIDMLEGKPDPLRSPHQINPSIPTEISDVLTKALEIRRENRFSSAVLMRQTLRTALVRWKERDAGEMKNQAPAPEFVPVKQVPTMPEPLEQDILEIEVVPNSQFELLKQRLQEAEKQRLLAEQRAADAEKRLLEKETEQPKAEEVMTPAETEQDPVPAAKKAMPEFHQTPVLSELASDEFENLFAQPQKEGKLFRRMAAGLGVLAVLGGASWGVWNFVISKPEPLNQAISNQTVSADDSAKPVPTVESTTPAAVENAPVSSYQTVSETENKIPAETADSSETSETTENQTTSPAVKNKPAVQPSPVKKPAATPAKTPEKQKKSVTLDDLIKDN